jgi:hypothetical protein
MHRAGMISVWSFIGLLTGSLWIALGAIDTVRFSPAKGK